MRAGTERNGRRIALISPYELGRQPYALAHPAAHLIRAGHRVQCIDLSLQSLDETLRPDTDLIAIHLAMHTATRIALNTLPKIKSHAPKATLCTYGLYAQMNAELFYGLGVDAVFGAEAVGEIVRLAGGGGGGDGGGGDGADGNGSDGDGGGGGGVDGDGDGGVGGDSGGGGGGSDGDGGDGGGGDGVSADDNGAGRGGDNGGDDGGDNDGVDGTDVAANRRAARNTVPAAQALDNTLLRVRLTPPSAAGTVAANAVAVGGADGGKDDDGVDGVDGGDNGGDGSGGGIGADSDSGDVAADRRTARNTVPAAQVLDEHLPKNNSRPPLSAAGTVTANAATVSGAVSGGNGTNPTFLLPDRTSLPPLQDYASLILPDGTTKTCGFAETTFGCKHLCRHCPVVPVYGGRFRAVPAEMVLGDIAQQVRAGAEHISFGDPDFFNGPTHARRIVRAMAEKFPGITFDATIKIQHLLRHAELLPELARHGCLFITSAVESLDDAVLEKLLKNHTRTDFIRAHQLLHSVGIALAPTFIPFTPWSTTRGYLALLRAIAEMGLVHSVPPVQLSIRLLVPDGSHLLHIPGFAEKLGAFDRETLGWPWQHPQPAVDELYESVHAWVAESEERGAEREEIFAGIWQRACAAADSDDAQPKLGKHDRPIPRMSEAWYCCAEPVV